MTADEQLVHYTAILRNAPEYVPAAQSRRIDWRFRPFTDQPLGRLYHTYDLGRFRTDGSDWETVLSLTGWIYQITTYAGDQKDPSPANAETIVSQALSQRGYLNCRMRSIALYELLLATGVFARPLHCYPREYDGDCHVVVLAYLRERSKWVAVDGMHNTYFHDSGGVPLSPMEARHATAAGSPPRFRHIATEKSAPLELAGTQHESYDSFYRNYMAKNLYWFAMPLLPFPVVDDGDATASVVLRPSHGPPLPGDKYLAWWESRGHVELTSSPEVFFADPAVR